MKQNNKNTLSSKKRLLQIISILKKHHLTKGIDPVKFRVILEDLGPTFVKIGQIMSSRQDMFSQRYCKELIKLRDNVAPLDIETVYNVIENGVIEPKYQQYEQVMSLADGEISKILMENRNVDSSMKIFQRSITKYLQQQR